MQTLAELKAWEDEVWRERGRLNETINEVERLHAEREVMAAFRFLRERVMAVGKRRLELAIQVAHAERSG